MTEWSVELKGHELDIATWAEALPEGYDPFVSQIMAPGSEHGKYCLKSIQFDDCRGALEVREIAKPLISQLNALMFLEHRCQPVEFESVYKHKPDGSVLRNLHIELKSFALRSTFGKATIAVNGEETAAQVAQQGTVQIMLGLQNSHYSDALMHLSRSDNWRDLYMAYEAIREVLGGAHRVEKRIGKDRLDNFALTAQLYRHTKSKVKRQPKQRQSLDEGKEFVAQLIRMAVSDMSTKIGLEP